MHFNFNLSALSFTINNSGDLLKWIRIPFTSQMIMTSKTIQERPIKLKELRLKLKVIVRSHFHNLQFSTTQYAYFVCLCQFSNSNFSKTTLKNPLHSFMINNAHDNFSVLSFRNYCVFSTDPQSYDLILVNNHNNYSQIHNKHWHKLTTPFSINDINWYLIRLSS